MTKLVLRISGKLPGKSHNRVFFFSQLFMEQSEGEAIEGALTSIIHFCKPMFQSKLTCQCLFILNSVLVRRCRWKELNPSAWRGHGRAAFWDLVYSGGLILNQIKSSTGYQLDIIIALRHSDGTINIHTAPENTDRHILCPKDLRIWIMKLNYNQHLIYWISPLAQQTLSHFNNRVVSPNLMHWIFSAELKNCRYWVFDTISHPYHIYTEIISTWTTGLRNILTVRHPSIVFMFVIVNEVQILGNRLKPLVV